MALLLQQLAQTAQDLFLLEQTQAITAAQEVVRDLEGLGARAQVVEIRPTDVNSTAVAQTLEKFSGFWFSGGDQSRLSSLLVGTRALQTIEARYQAGAVVGGTSAGASVMSPFVLPPGRRGSGTT